MRSQSPPGSFWKLSFGSEALPAALLSVLATTWISGGGSGAGWTPVVLAGGWGALAVLLQAAAQGWIPRAIAVPAVQALLILPALVAATARSWPGMAQGLGLLGAIPAVALALAALQAGRPGIASWCWAVLLVLRAASGPPPSPALLPLGGPASRAPLLAIPLILLAAGAWIRGITGNRSARAAAAMGVSLAAQILLAAPGSWPFLAVAAAMAVSALRSGRAGSTQIGLQVAALLLILSGAFLPELPAGSPLLPVILVAIAACLLAAPFLEERWRRPGAAFPATAAASGTRREAGEAPDRATNPSRAGGFILVPAVVLPSVALALALALPAGYALPLDEPLVLDRDHPRVDLPVEVDHPVSRIKLVTETKHGLRLPQGTLVMEVLLRAGGGETRRFRLRMGMELTDFSAENPRIGRALAHGRGLLDSWRAEYSARAAFVFRGGRYALLESFSPLKPESISFRWLLHPGYSTRCRIREVRLE
jgi:hypothetical protein